MSPRCAMSARSNVVTVPARASDNGRWTELINSAQSGAGAWRIIELASFEGYAFEARLMWTAGQGAGRRAEVDVSRGTRISVYARDISSIQVRNLTDTAHKVMVAIADGHATTANHRTVEGDGDGVREDAIQIPDFARTTRLEMADPSGINTARIDLYNGQGTLTSRTMGDTQPPEGIPLAGAHTLKVVAEGVFRVVFALHL